MAIDWEAEFANIGEELPSILNQYIIDAANIVIEEIRARAPQGDGPNAGALKRSIRARIVDGNFVGISMIDYGWYQNYGVKGINNKKTQYGVPGTLSEYLGVPPDYIYKFGTGNSGKGKGWGAYYSGIDAQLFFNVRQDLERITEIINQNLEL